VLVDLTVSQALAALLAPRMTDRQLGAAHGAYAH